MPVLGAQIHAFKHITAQFLELIQPGRPHQQNLHALFHAEIHGLTQGVVGLAAKIEQHQHVGLG